MIDFLVQNFLRIWTNLEDVFFHSRTNISQGRYAFIYMIFITCTATGYINTGAHSISQALVGIFWFTYKFLVHGIRVNGNNTR